MIRQNLFYRPIAELLSFNPDIAQGKTLRDMEMDAIQSSLQRNEGNKAKAADELGISLKTLYNKLNQTFDGCSKVLRAG